MTHTHKNNFYPVTVNKPAKFVRATKDTRMGRIQLERLPKSKMASSDDRFTFKVVHVLRFGNELNKELCCRFIFTNLQQSLDL